MCLENYTTKNKGGGEIIKLDRLISYSCLSAYEQCPYQWYLKYIEDRDDRTGNFYAHNGTLVHEVLEDVANGVINIEDSAMEYLTRTEELYYPRLNKDTKEKVIGACLDFFTEYDFDIFDSYEIVGTELEVFFNIGDYHFRGFIDLLLKDGDGNYIVFDYKSSSYPLKRNGDVKKASEKTVDGYIRQAYFYAEGVKATFNSFPKSLNWLFFKDQKVMTIRFSEEKLEEVKKWALGVIGRIENDIEFLATNTQENYFMCHQLCDYRENCEYLGDDDE